MAAADRQGLAAGDELEAGRPRELLNFARDVLLNKRPADDARPPPSSPPPPPPRPSAPRPRVMPGVDERAFITIPWLVALKGGPFFVAVRRAGGLAHVSLDVPTGCWTGHNFRVAGQGGPGTPPGDLVLVVTAVEPHPIWHRDGVDIVTRMRVTFADLYAERTVAVLSPWGHSVAVRLKANAFRPIRIAGEGLHIDGLHGALVVELEVVWPRPHDDELAAVLQRVQAGDRLEG